VKTSPKFRARLIKIRNYAYATLSILIILVATILSFGGPKELVVGCFIVIIILLPTIAAITKLAKRRKAKAEKKLPDIQK